MVTFVKLFTYLWTSRISGTGQGLEHFLSCTANRAFPLFRQVFKLDALRDFSFPVTLVRVVYTFAIYSLTLTHLLRFRHFFSL